MDRKAGTTILNHLYIYRRTKLKQYEEEYALLKVDDEDDGDDVIDIQDVETKLKQYEEEYKDKNEYYVNVLNQFKINNKFFIVARRTHQLPPRCVP